MDEQMAINRSLFFSFGSGTARYPALKIQHGRMSNQTRTFNTDSGLSEQRGPYKRYSLASPVRL